MNRKPSKPSKRTSKDHPHVLAMEQEAKRLGRIEANLLRDPDSNPQAIMMVKTYAWGMEIASAWLRCHIAGEFEKTKKTK